MTAADVGAAETLRTQNDRAAFWLMLQHGPLSRSRLAQLSGTSKPTAAQMVARLARLGLVEPVGESAEARGPNAVVYAVRPGVAAGVAVSMVPGAAHAVLVDAAGTPHPTVEVSLPLTGRTPETDVHAALHAACTAANVPLESLSLVAVGVQAAVDTKADVLSYTDTLPGWPEQGSRTRLGRATGLSVRIENDVNLATMAERTTPQIDNHDTFAYLWLGDGLGVGFDVSGHVQRGASGGAGEIGYIEVPRSAVKLDPEAADFTDLLGGPAIVRLLGGLPGQPLEEALRTLRADTSKRVAAVADRVAVVVEQLAALLDPGLVVLGGPTGVAGGSALADAVRDRVERAEWRHQSRSGLRSRPDRLQIVTSAAGDQPVLRGASQLVLNDLREQLEARIRDS